MVQQIRKHGPDDHMPSGPDALPWLGGYNRTSPTDPGGIHMIGTLANRPDPSPGTTSGSDGVVTHGFNLFQSASANFYSLNTGDTIQITDTIASPPVIYSFTVTFLTFSGLDLSSNWMGNSTTGTVKFPWVLTGRGPSNAGLHYYANDAGSGAVGTLFESDGVQWIPMTAGSTGLPPWYQWSPSIQITPGVTGVSPTVSVDPNSYVMVQTIDGIAANVGGVPMNLGTLLGQIKFTLTSVGSITAAYTPVPALGIYLTDAPSTYIPTWAIAAGNHTVGHGYITQVSTGVTFQVEVVYGGANGVGGLYVPNVPDFADLSGQSGVFSGVEAIPNLCRLANPYLTPPVTAWPFDWASGDQISVSYTTPMTTGL